MEVQLEYHQICIAAHQRILSLTLHQHQYLIQLRVQRMYLHHNFFNEMMNNDFIKLFFV